MVGHYLIRGFWEDAVCLYDKERNCIIKAKQVSHIMHCTYYPHPTGLDHSLIHLHCLLISCPWSRRVASRNQDHFQSSLYFHDIWLRLWKVFPSHAYVCLLFVSLFGFKQSALHFGYICDTWQLFIIQI